MTVPFLAGCYIWTSRASRNASTGLSSPETAYLSKIQAHVENNTASAMTAQSDAVFKAAYYMQVATGTDIVEGDIVTSITLLDGLTPWPNIRPGPITQQPAVPGAGNLLYRVVGVREDPTVFLPVREVWFDYIVGGGPA